MGKGSERKYNTKYKRERRYELRKTSRERKLEGRIK